MVRDLLSRYDRNKALTPCDRALLKAMSLEKPGDIIAAIHRHGWDRTRLAALVPMVLPLAESDKNLSRIVEDSASALVAQISTVWHRMKLNELDTQYLFTGGLLTGSDYYLGLLQRFLKEKGNVGADTQLIDKATPGAVKLALELVANRKV
jgi:N-acetylglucosamine kinase-like BadF-type ATPase